MPNQMKGANWNAANDHIEGTFANFGIWPQLQANLRANSGGLGIYSAELAFMSPATVSGIRSRGLTINIDPPGWTQPIDGTIMADVELNGRSPPGQNIFCSNFLICSPTDRPDPNGRGWFVDATGAPVHVDEITLDERLPGLLPDYSNLDVLAGPGTWEQRKAAARVDQCPQCDQFNAPVDRVTGLINDYVEFARVMKAKWASPPKLSFYWVVHPGWEWRDEKCLDALNARYPNPADFRTAFAYLTQPCHQGSEVLDRLVTALCNDGSCPEAVYMDIEIIYNTDWALDVLRRNKAVLARHNVGFGLIINDHASAQRGFVATILPDFSRFIKFAQNDGTSENQLNQISTMNLAIFLKQKGIIDANTLLHLQSYSTDRPLETGARVAETVGGSFASTANRIINEILVPAGFARTP